MSIPIRGVSHGSAGAAFETAKRRGAQRLDFLLDYLKALYADCATVGIRADVLVSQADLETGSFTSRYWIEDGNPAGLAAFDDGSNWGLTFTPQKAARAHVVHMLCYLGIEPPDGWKDADARWDAAVKAGYFGSVDTTTDLGNGRWATDPKYAEKLESRHAAYNFAPPVITTPQKPTEGKSMAIEYGKVPQFGFIDRYIAEKREGFGWNNLGQRRPLWVTLHRMVGNLWGTDGWFRNPTVSSITDYGIGIERVSGKKNAGVILRWNDPKGIRSGWASGPVSAPYGDGLAAVNKYGINGVNRFGVSIEGDGTDEPFDEFSWNELVHFIAYWADQAKVPYTSFPLNPETGFSFVIFHEEFTYGTGKRCPFPWMKGEVGRLIKDVKAMLQKYQEGTVVTPKPTPQEPKPDVTPKPGEAFPVTKGTMVRTVKGVLAREAASTSAKVVMDLPAGMVGMVENAGTQTGDGIVWFDFRGPGGTGWVPVADFEAYTPEVVEPEKMWKDPAPVVELAMVNPDTAGDLKLQNGVNFRPVFDEVRAVKQGKQRRFAIDGDNVDVIGPDYKPGDQFTAMYRFTNDTGTEYFYLSNHARVLFEDFERIAD